jgi:hypothetical protein
MPSIDFPKRRHVADIVWMMSNPITLSSRKSSLQQVSLLSSRRKPGPIAAMDTGLRRYDEGGTVNAASFVVGVFDDRRDTPA